MTRLICARVAGALLLAGCVQTNWRSGYGPSQTLATADQMMDVEETDRVNRFERLARLAGVTAPDIEQMVVAAAAVPGATRPIPIIRVVFDEQVFFDTGSAVPGANVAKVLDLIAENMRHDVPDLRITVLGHTDAVGDDAGNTRLSQQRALAVLQMLVRDGVNPGQLGTVAIGRTQPIASNASAAGRARNRRVEFLISPSEAANLAVVQKRPINLAFLAAEPGGTTRSKTGAARVQFLKPAYRGPADVSEGPVEERRITLAVVGTLPLQAPTQAVEDTGSPVVRAALARPAGETGSPAAPP